MITTRPNVIVALASWLTCATVALATSPASAAEQCRFISAKAEREACYARQDAELAARRNKAEAKSDVKRDTTMESLQQMKQEDVELNRQIHGICRGC